MAPGTASWIGQPRVKGKTEFTRMLLLTFSIIGLQFAWGTEMTYANPYLLSLGLSKSKLSLVWIAGPLSGLIMQPIIGMISDKCPSKYGRRRPFMFGGSVAVAVCLIVLGWSDDIVGRFVSNEHTRRSVTAALAIIDIYVLDFVINIAQSTCRALVVDTLPVSKQQLGSAWVGRMVGVGHMFVYAIGSMDLSRSLGTWFGATQFKKVCAIAAIAMVVSQGVTCYAVHERIFVSDGRPQSAERGLVPILKQIYSTVANVPDRIQNVCWVQFWAWIGWFPFLFYGSTWAGEIYLRQHAPASPADALSEIGRVGSTALIVYSLVGFAASVVLPWIVRSPDDENDRPVILAPKPPYRLQSLMRNAHTWRPSLLTTWMIAHLMFACSMIFAPAVQSVGFATFLLSFCGIPSAVGALASGTFIGIEVNKMCQTLPTSSSPHPSDKHYHRRSSTASVDFELDDPYHNNADPDSLHLHHDDPFPISATSAAVSSATLSSTAPNTPSNSTGELSGIYLGILNIYTTLPQFVGTGISWVVFSIFEPAPPPEALGTDLVAIKKTGQSGIAICLFIGALSACVAAWSTRKLK